MYYISSYRRFGGFAGSAYGEPLDVTMSQSSALFFLFCCRWSVRYHDNAVRDEKAAKVGYGDSRANGFPSRHYGSLMRESDGELPGCIYCHEGCPARSCSQTQLRKLIVQLLFAAEDPKLSLQLAGHWGLPLGTPWGKSLDRLFSPELCSFGVCCGFLSVFWVF